MKESWLNIGLGWSSYDVSMASSRVCLVTVSETTSNFLTEVSNTAVVPRS